MTANETDPYVACVEEERLRGFRIQVFPHARLGSAQESSGVVVVTLGMKRSPIRSTKRREAWWYQQHREAA